MPGTEELLPAIRSLLRQAGCAAGNSIRLDVLPAGGNNRVFRIDLPDDRYVVKHYFRSADDPRDRLAAEFDFLRHAETAAPGWAPRALARDDALGLGLYEFIDGQRPAVEMASAAHVVAAVDFLRAVNAPAARSAAGALPPASEACFSVARHLELVGARIGRLADAVRADASAHAARPLADALEALWPGLSRTALDSAAAAGIDPNAALPDGQRCLSPSDFGFHNALQSTDGKIRFVDFEYAGWDDPAKTAGDFFCQLSVPVPPEHFDRFVANIAQISGDPSGFTARARLLLPVYRAKWCCIAMNVFQPEHLARRRFADPSLDVAALGRSRLERARRLFQSLAPSPRHGLH